MNIDKMEMYMRGFDRFLGALPPLDEIDNDDDFMDIVFELMNYTLNLHKIVLSLSPSQENAERGLTKRKAVIVGHMIRQMKLYEGFVIHISKNQSELASIFVRLIYETVVRTEYLARSKYSSIKSYILSSYRSDKENLDFIKKLSRTRKLIPIEKRIKEKITNRLNRDGISQKKLFSNRKWRLDGKSFRDILVSLNREHEYSFGFGSASHFVHGNWYELSNHHLEKRGRRFFPLLDFDKPDPRLACPTSILCLLQLINYVNWSKVDPNSYLLPKLRNLKKVFISIDSAHEKFYIKKYGS